MAKKKQPQVFSYRVDLESRADSEKFLALLERASENGELKKPFNVERIEQDGRRDLSHRQF